MVMFLLVDCVDGSDERGCRCADYLKRTKPSYLCDGYAHCQDWSDEVKLSRWLKITGQHLVRVFNFSLTLKFKTCQMMIRFVSFYTLHDNLDN